MGRLLGAPFVLCAVLAQGAFAHPAPFSYLDLRLDGGNISGTLVIHDFDAAHELGVAEPQTLLDPSVAQERARELTSLIDERLRIAKDGEPATLQWRPGVQVLAGQQSLRFDFILASEGAAGRVEIDAVLFPYDGNHQTFINLYEAGRLERQAVLNASAHRFEHYAGTIQGRSAVVRRFVALGVEHILIGPDHLLFLLGLLLLGGSLWRLATIVTSFTDRKSVV